MKRKARSDGSEFLRGVWLERMRAVFEEDLVPWPLLELKRRSEVLRLREMVPNWPREAFNRWLMERLQEGDLLLGDDDTELGRAAKAAAERLKRLERSDEQVVATLEARRGSYVLSLEGEEEFTVSPSALARLAPSWPVANSSRSR